MKNIPKIPLIIGGVFIVDLAVIIATTITLRKELIRKEPMLEGKFRDRVGATFVGSETCNMTRPGLIGPSGVLHIGKNEKDYPLPGRLERSF